MIKNGEYVRRLQARLIEVAAGRELEAIARGKPVPESVREIRALVAERVEGSEGSVDGEAVPARPLPMGAPISSATTVRTTLRDVLRKALNLVDHEDVVIMRAGSDYQVRLSGRGLARVEMRYVDDERHVGNFRPACPWFTFEGFSVDAVLADDWEIVDAPTPKDA